MTRYARINAPFGVYHVISRLMRNEFLIADVFERERYLETLGRVCRHTDAEILGWCLMSNHIHLVVRAGKEPLARLMKPLNTGFAAWLARRLKLRGPIFADRFKSILVDEEAYLLELLRYVHNNPVRAGIVSDPSSSKWSSHRIYIGMEEAPPWLNIGYVLAMFSPNVEEARTLFHHFVQEGLTEKRRPDLSGDGLKNMGRQIETGFGDGWRVSGPIVGNESFAAKVLADLSNLDEKARHSVAVEKDWTADSPSLIDLIGAACVQLDLEPWEFDQQPQRRRPAMARRIVTYLWVQKYKNEQIEIARHLGVSTGAVSRWYAKAIREITDIEPLCDAIVQTLRSMKRPNVGEPSDCTTRYNLQFEQED